MDKHLRPSRFDGDPSSSTVEKEWKHWKRTFTNFIAKLTFSTDAATQQTEKLNTLINYISAEVYEYIGAETTYDNAIAKLEALYVKPANVIFNR